MDLRKVRDVVKMLWGGVFAIIYLPHIIAAFAIKDLHQTIKGDVESYCTRVHIKLNFLCGLIFLLHNDSYFRTLFYHRLGPVVSALIGWYAPKNKTFIIPAYTKIGRGVLFFHPYSTVLNAESIGDNFTCAHLTTLGLGRGGKPIIGNNVHLGANVTIIGNVKIGDNVTIGAGSIVVKNVPDNSVVVGPAAKVIRSF